MLERYGSDRWGRVIDAKGAPNIRYRVADRSKERKVQERAGGRGIADEDGQHPNEPLDRRRRKRQHKSHFQEARRVKVRTKML